MDEYSFVDQSAADYGYSDPSQQVDTSAVDTSVSDPTAVDTAAVDTSVVDTIAAVDTSTVDTSTVDTSTVDTSTTDTTVMDTSVADALASAGYENLGGGQWYDAMSNSTYDEASGVWISNDQTAVDSAAAAATMPPADLSSFVDPISGTTINSDGSFVFPDGTTLNVAGDYQFGDGTKLLADGDYIDASGDTWHNLADANAPQVWVNDRTGDAWNMQDGTLVPATMVQGTLSGDTITYDQYLAGLKDTDPAEYARLTQPTTTPGGSPVSSGGGSSGGGSGGGLAPAAPAAKGVTLDDLNKLLKTAVSATQGVTTARNSGAPANQIAALQHQAQIAAQNVAAAKAAGVTIGNHAASPSTGVSSFLTKNSSLLIAAAGIAALLLFSSSRPSTRARHDLAA